MKALTQLFILIPYLLFSQEKITSKVIDITIYINKALVHRTGIAEIKEGKSEIIITGLSPYLDPKSIEFKPNAQINILSINHKFNFSDTLHDVVLRKKLDQIKVQITAQSVEKKIIQEQLEFWRDNHTISKEGNGGNLVTLKEISTYHYDQIKTLHTKDFEIDQAIVKLKEEQLLVEKEINQSSSIKKQPESNITISINSKARAKLNFDLKYVVENVNWFPTYNIQVDNLSKPISIDYKANILQNSKEDWKDVKITLSSANPALGGLPPTLITYFLDYYSSPPVYSNDKRVISGTVYDEESKEPLVGASIHIKGTTIGTLTDTDGKFNLIAKDINSILIIEYVGFETLSIPISNAGTRFSLKPGQALQEVVVTGYSSSAEERLTGRAAGVNSSSNSKPEAEEKLPLPVIEKQNSTSFNFEINTPYTLLSDNKPFTIELQTVDIPSKLSYYSIPKIDKDAFLLADIVDYEKYNLLDGEANIFLEGSFVGKTLIESQTTSDTIHLSLGRDKSIIVSRSLVKDHTSKRKHPTNHTFHTNTLGDKFA